MPQITVTLPKPLAWQEQVIREARRYNVVDIGRRAGKTTLGINRTADPDVLRHPVGWFSPTYKDMLEVWREVSSRMAPITQRLSTSERRLEFVTGGVLEFWSADNPQAGRGRKYRRVIIDEAAFVPALLDLWNYAVRPTLTDMSGDAWILSTPKGRNGFWQMWHWGQDAERPEWRSWQMPSSVNPLLPPVELEDMRRNLPERVYQQEIEATFLDDAGGVFRKVMDAATARAQDEAIPGHEYLIGVDWGKHSDFTVLAVLDITTNELVYLDRFNQIDYTLQRGRLEALYKRFRPHTIMAERNSIGDPAIEELARAGMPVQPFTTTNASKAQAIDGLSLAFEQQALRILPDAVLIGELQSYEAERLPSGMLRYSAPEGMHDDTVMALAIAWHGAQTTGPIQLTESPFYA